jgi:N-glycosylase/DNA lyase
MLYGAQPRTSVSEVAAFACSPDELDLEHTLASGQAFRWRKDKEGWWATLLEPDHLLVRLWQDEDQIFYETRPAARSFSRIRDYFQLDTDLAALTKHWIDRAGQEISTATGNFRGLRVVRQDPVECLFTFLCTPAAPIYRIRRSVDAMCRTLGGQVADVAGLAHYSFPSIESLAESSRAVYDKMGLGFRGGNIRLAARGVLDLGGEEWLRGLRELPYAAARAQLSALPGVGLKIADCVCLFSLDKNDAVPIDVHMARVAKRLFTSSREMRTLTGRAYEDAANHFRQRFGEHAGWAQQYLYYNELVHAGLWDEELGKHRPRQTEALKPG